MKQMLLYFMFAIFTVGSHAQELLDKIVAVVDDKIILYSELNQIAFQMSLQMGIDPQKDVEQFSKLRQNALESLVSQKVLLTKAQEDSIVADERQVDQYLDERLKLILQELGSEAKVEEYFGQPMRKIRRTLRKEIEEGLLVRSLQQRKYREIRISRREVEEFYRATKDSLPTIQESVKLSHILFNIQAGDEAVQRARVRIEEVKAKLAAGEDFATLAGQYSEDPGSSKRGGELGFIQRGDFVREFEEAAFALQPGEISDIVQSQFGFHIIQLLDRRGEKINCRHVLISLPMTEGDAERTRQKAENVREEIVSGKITFEEAVAKYSNDLTTNEKDGGLGWFEISQLQIKEFVAVSKALEVGEISQPVKTQFGYHLVRLDDRREPRQYSLKDDWQEIEDMAITKKADSDFKRWLDSIKEDTYIRVAEAF